MNCKVCGTEITNPAAVFCPNCGSKLNEAAEAKEAPAAEAPVAGAAVAAAAAAPISPAGPTPQAQSAYADPRQSALFNENWAPIVKVGEWLGSLLILTLVPLALSIIAALVEQLMPSSVLSSIISIVALLSGLIIVLCFAFSKRFNPSKRNFFKAYLILMLIMIALCIVLLVIFFQYFAANSDQITEILNNLTY